MIFPSVALVFLAVWGLAAVQLAPRLRAAGPRLAWVGGALALAAVACVVHGATGLARHGDWATITVAQALHAVFGEGTVLMRRADSAALNRAAGVYLNTDIAWTLLALCVLQFQSIGFWSGVAEGRRRRARRG